MNRERVFGNAVFVSTPYNVIEEQDALKNSCELIFVFALLSKFSDDTFDQWEFARFQARK